MSRSLVVVTAFLSVLALAAPAGAAVGDISTVAGTGTGGFNGDGIPATSAQLTTPVDAIASPGGGFLIADQVNFRVRKVAPDGTITTVAGSGGPQASSGDGGPATSAKLAAPSGLAYLPGGSILIAEANGNRIRKVDAATGTITTVAGTGGAGFSGDNGPATSAQIRFPYDIRVFSDGSYVFVDQDNNRIRYVTAGGTISTFGSTGTAGALNDPAGLSLMPDGSILIADTNNNRIRRAYANGTITDVAGTGTAGFAGDGGPATVARLDHPIRVESLAGGGYLIADRDNHRVRRVDVDGNISTIAGDGTAADGGDGGPATSAHLNRPYSVAVLANQDIIVADSFNQRIRLIDESEDAVTPPPPPPPPPPPVISSPPPTPIEANVTPPTIITSLVTDDDPLYVCSTGTWVGLKPGSTYKYEWRRITKVTTGPVGFPVSIYTHVSSSKAYRLPDTLRGATLQCIVTATTESGKSISAASKPTVLSGYPKFDTALETQTYGNAKVYGIDVFQTSQPSAGSQRFLPQNPSFPISCGAGTPTNYGVSGRTGCNPGTLLGRDPQKVAYAGVGVDGNMPATAIVYAERTEKTSVDAQVDITLRARLGGKYLSGAMTKRTKLPVQSDLTVSAVIRTVSGTQFQLPQGWLTAAGETDKLFDLEASVSIVPPGAAPVVQCDGLLDSCTGDDTFRVQNIGVWTDLAALEVTPIALLNSGQTLGSLLSPDFVLSAVRDIYPGGGRLTIRPYRAIVDISGKRGAGLQTSDDFCEDIHRDTDIRACRWAGVDATMRAFRAIDARIAPPTDVTVGVHQYPDGLGGAEVGWTPSDGGLGSPSGALMFTNDGSLDRPVTAAGHEWGHVMGAGHAGTAAVDPVGGQPCGARQGTFEEWPPDNTGRIQAAAYGRYLETFDTRWKDVEIDGPSGPIYDLMSYCLIGERLAWLSPYNWARAFDRLRSYKAAGRRSADDARTAVTGQGFVVGTATPDGIHIDRVVAADPDNAVPAPEPGSPVQITTLGASGQPITTVGAHVAGNSEDSSLQTFIAPLPAGAAAITATNASGAADKVARTQPPTVKLVAPRAGTRVGGSAKDRLDVRWTAKDPDSPALEATVEYAPDGRSFKTVWQGPSTGRASLRGDLFAAGRNGRLRVTVDDGFNRARALSGAITTAGSAPAVSIALPLADGRKRKAPPLQAGAPTMLTGQGVDDAGRPLAGKALTWFAGSKRLGSGASLRATLPAGTVRLRLVARDGAGRTATASRTVRVLPVALRLGRFDVPARVKPKVKSVAITVSASTAATLTIGGRRYAIGTKARKLTVKLPSRPATGALTLAYTVTASGVKQADLRGKVAVLRV